MLLLISMIQRLNLKIPTQLFGWYLVNFLALDLSLESIRSIYLFILLHDKKISRLSRYHPIVKIIQ